MTNQIIDTVPSASPEDVDHVLSIAQKGSKIWGSKTAEDRAAILFKSAEALMDEQKAIATLLSKETGKPYQQSLGCVDLAAQLFHGYAEKAKHIYGHTLPNTEDLITVQYEPLGVVVCITPFNFPIELYGHKAAPALAAGNAVVIKPASDTPLSTIYMTEVLIRSGIPAEALNVITGNGSIVGRALADSPKVNGISLTGSTAVGIDIMKHCAQNMTRTFMELGGNDGVIILDDANIDYAVEEAINGRIYNAGQVCCAPKRFIVQNTILQEFSDKLVRRIHSLKIGDPFNPQNDMGCLISENAAIEVEQQVNSTISLGATCLCGGVRYNSTFYQPTVLIDVTADMPIAKDMEIFGPVFPIIGFNTDKEALDILNQSSYGLSGGVIGENTKRAFGIAKQIDAGGAIVNGTGMYRTIYMPFGGHKKSGIGTEGFLETLQEMMRTKSIVFKGLQ
ncbi:MAG: aldehyde dehydrogenase family protein [Lachnospiraceae bacterium]